MKRILLTIFSLFLIICPALNLSALELGFDAGVNFLTYDPLREDSYERDIISKQFVPFPFLTGNIYVKDDINAFLSYSAKIGRDNILLNNLEGSIKARTDYLSFEFGVFVGMNDLFLGLQGTGEQPNFGLLGSIEFSYPGFIFISACASTTLGGWQDSSGLLSWVSDTVRETGQIKLGFWVQNVISSLSLLPSVSVEVKSLSRAFQLNSIDIIRKDTLTRYQISVDFYAKNFPFTFRVDAGYEKLFRSYDSAGVYSFDEIRTFYAGLYVDWRIIHPLSVNINIEMPFLLSSLGSMTVDNIYLAPKITIGAVYRFNSRNL